MRIIRYLLVSGFVCLLTINIIAGTKPVNETDSLTEGNIHFALELYERLSATKGNLFLSPYSISTALAMTYGGARENTAKQIAQVFHFSENHEIVHSAFSILEANLNSIEQKGSIQLNIANSLWPHNEYPFLKSYLALTKRFYAVEITSVDYVHAVEQARIMINTWVEKKTHDKIKDIISPNTLSAFTRLVLVNAIYFKGNWRSQFEKKATRKTDFYVSPSESVSVPMMYQEENFGYGVNSLIQILELPYEGYDLSMIILLPQKKDGLREIERSLNVRSLKRWTNNLRKQKVRVFFPKFKMTNQFGMAPMLESMGMPDAFSSRQADFSGMDGRKGGLFIGNVIHKAFIEVDEKGTEAAAATAVVMRMTSMPAASPVFRADHPFVFVIRDNTSGSVLFMGRVSKP